MLPPTPRLLPLLRRTTVRSPFTAISTTRHFRSSPTVLFTTSPAQRGDDAFDPSKTRPENEDSEDVPVSELGRETAKDPANDIANKARSSTEPQGSKAETGQGGKERDGPSHSGSPKKNGGPGKD